MLKNYETYMQEKTFISLNFLGKNIFTFQMIEVTSLKRAVIYKSSHTLCKFCEDQQLCLQTLSV